MEESARKGDIIDPSDVDHRERIIANRPRSALIGIELVKLLRLIGATHGLVIYPSCRDAVGL